MNAKKIVVSCFAVVLTATLVAADTGNVQKKRPSLEEIKARRAAHIAAEGGLVNRPPKGKVVRVLLRTKDFSESDARAVAENMSRTLHLCVEVGETEGQSKAKTGCLITLADMDKAPTLLVAPEDYWATVNVNRLKDDNPSPDILKSRIVKEMWRALGFALGAANPSQFTCVMRPISTPADLDKEKVAQLTPPPMMAVVKTAAQLGFSQGGQTTYRRACQEGWASQPTNAVQKTIWEEVHAIPDQPLTIKKQK